MGISNGSYTFLYCNPISTFDVWTTNLGGESEPINMAVFDNKTMIDIVWLYGENMWKHVNTQLWSKHLNLQHPSPEPPPQKNGFRLPRICMNLPHRTFGRYISQFGSKDSRFSGFDCPISIGGSDHQPHMRWSPECADASTLWMELVSAGPQQGRDVPGRLVQVGVSINRGTPNSWLVFNGTSIYKWMIRVTPFQETSRYVHILYNHADVDRGFMRFLMIFFEHSPRIQFEWCLFWRLYVYVNMNTTVYLYIYTYT